MNIIIQSGGLGTRMNSLTSIKPKCLIPIDGKPILFHLLDSNPEANFFIIADYCAETLIKYTKKFRPNHKIKYIFPKDKSTSAGIKEAASFIDGSFYVIWSDLIIKQKLIEQKCSTIGIGLTNNKCKFPCRWSVENSKLIKKESDISGVSGVFWFKNKNFVEKIDETKSLTNYFLSEKFETFDIENIEDVGNEQRFYFLHKNNRFFNKLTFFENSVKKEAIIPEYEKLINNEIFWYKHVDKLNFKRVPKLLSTNPLTLEKLKGKNPFDCVPNENFMLDCIDVLKNLHNLEEKEKNTNEMELVYLTKTLERVYSVCDLIPFFNDDFITINNKKYLNPFSINNLQDFKNTLKKIDTDSFKLIHGDCTFSNMINVDGKAYLIDPRGYFGENKLYGDPKYDWAKLYYSFVGNYDNVNSKKYKITINENSVYFDIDKNGWEKYEELFFQNIPYSKKEIKILHSIIWFSLCGYVIEDYSSILLSFYNGIVLWNAINL